MSRRGKSRNPWSKSERVKIAAATGTYPVKIVEPGLDKTAAVFLSPGVIIDHLTSQGADVRVHPTGAIMFKESDGSDTINVVEQNPGKVTQFADIAEAWEKAKPAKAGA